MPLKKKKDGSMFQQWSRNHPEQELNKCKITLTSSRNIKNPIIKDSLAADGMNIQSFTHCIAWQQSLCFLIQLVCESMQDSISWKNSLIKVFKRLINIHVS